MKDKKIYTTLEYGGKLPRRIKKQILGKKLNRRKLKALLASVKLDRNTEGSVIGILPYMFCPNCGCESFHTIDHHAKWPEIWIEDYCRRCNHFVGGADNSPYITVFECMGLHS